MAPKKIFTDEDAELLENLYESGKLKLGAIASNLKRLPIWYNFSQDFHATTLKKHMDNVAKKVAIKMSLLDAY